MFYAWPITVAAENDASNPAEITMPMSAGVIHQVDVLFPINSNNYIHVQVFDASLQLWPTNRNGTIRGNASVISFRDFYEMKTDNNTLKGLAWWEDVETTNTIIIQVGVLNRAILQPFSLAELLRAVQRG